MTPTEIRRHIMSQATEDLTGLWELPATAGAPGVDELITVLSDLISRNLVTVYTGIRFASEETLLPAATAQKAIRDQKFWDWSAPERGPHLRVLATPAGRAWYFGQERDAHTTAAE